MRKRLYENCDLANYSYPQRLGDDQIFKSFVIWSRIVEVTSSLMAGSHQQLQLSRFPDFKFAILLKIRTDSSFAGKFSHKNGAGGGLQIWTAHIKWISKMRYFEYWQRIMIIWWNEASTPTNSNTLTRPESSLRCPWCRRRWSPRCCCASSAPSGRSPSLETSSPGHQRYDNMIIDNWSSLNVTYQYWR